MLVRIIANGSLPSDAFIVATRSRADARNLSPSAADIQWRFFLRSACETTLRLRKRTLELINCAGHPRCTLRRLHKVLHSMFEFSMNSCDGQNMKIDRY